MPIVNLANLRFYFFFFHRESSHLKIGTVLDSLSWGEEPTPLGQDLPHCYAKLLLVSGWAVNWDLEWAKLERTLESFLLSLLVLAVRQLRPEGWNDWTQGSHGEWQGSGLRPGLCPWPGTTPQLLWHDPRGKTTGKLRLHVQSVLCIHKSPICRFNQPQKLPHTEGGMYRAILCKRLEHSRTLISKAGFWNQCPWIPREDWRDSVY